MVAWTSLPILAGSLTLRDRDKPCIMSSMLPRAVFMSALSLTAGILFAPPGTHAQIDTFHSRFDGVLTQHGVVGGGFAFVHGPAPATQYFFGEARGDLRQAIRRDTDSNSASLTKPPT